MIKPVTAALMAVASPKVNLWFSVSGEMGLSNFMNPREWITVLQQTRSQLKAKPWKVRLLVWRAVRCQCVAGIAAALAAVQHACCSGVDGTEG